MQAKGDCFEVNGKYFMKECSMDGNLDWRLAHGIVINARDHLPMTHCWIEYTNKLKFHNEDGSKSMEFDIEWIRDIGNGLNFNGPKSQYYRVGKIDSKNVVLYTLGDYQEKCFFSGTHGPWDIDCER
jgi:hypothetical protein